jgi:hypothetical protein
MVAMACVKALSAGRCTHPARMRWPAMMNSAGAVCPPQSR